MYLQSLEIIGFKSFAAKTVLQFHRGVTVIVGPNGCGKSNVLDAVRWVLGEQSAKALRGGEMADVIFSGTDSRAGLGMAEVSMTFADCEKDLGVAWNEVTITRRVFRDGQGEYFLNKAPCRLKDIHQLFMDTGVGRSAYSIMEQGKIDQILSSRPEDRRAIFEEAAGITRFKAQRKEALRKLEATEANLLRLTDVIREVKRQIGSLQRQAAKARRYQALVGDVRVLDTHNSRRVFDDLESQRWTVAEATERLRTTQELREREVVEQENAVAEQRLELEVSEEKLTEARQGVNELRNRITQGESRIGFNNERVTEFAGLVERYQRDIAGSEEKLSIQQTQIENTDLELETIQQSLAAEQAQLQERQASASELINQRAETERQYQSIFAQITKIESRLSGLRSEMAGSVSTRDGTQARMAILGEELQKLTAGSEALEARLAEMAAQVEQHAKSLETRKTEVVEAETLTRNTQAELSELDRTIHAESRRLQERESKLDVLRQLNADGEGFSQGTQAVLKGLDNPGFFKPAVLGALAQFIEVGPEYITAIEAALGQNLQAIVMKDTMVAEAVVKTLVEKKLGRTSLALRQLWTGTAAQLALEFAGLPKGAIGWAADQVKCQPDVEPLVRKLLADTVLVQNIETAVRLASESANEGSTRFDFVTLSGELVTKEGVLQGGQNKEGGSSVLQRKAQIASMETEAKAIRIVIAELNERRNDGANRLEAAQQRLQEVRDEAQTLNLTLSHLRGQLSVVEREVKENAHKLQNTGWERENLERRHNEAIARLGQLEEEAYTASTQIAEFQAQQTELQDSLTGLRENESMLTSELNEMRVRVATEKQRHSSLQNQRQPMNARLAELRELIEQRRRDIDTYTVKGAQLAEDSENIQAGVNQARGRLGEAEQHVNTLLTERTEMVTQVETMENLLRQTRHDLSSCHDQRSKLEVRASQIQLRQENLCEHIQRRYQLDIREFQPDSYLLLTTVRDHKKRLKSNVAGSDAENSESAEGEASAEAVESAIVEDVASAATETPGTGFVPSDHGDRIDWDFIESVVKELDQKLDSMGPVNVDAIQEYDELEERYKFLEQQNTDLNNSKAELLEVIARINQTTKTLFSDTFEQVRINFQEMFTELFGGGKANLVLLDESDPLESGIEIIAKPPGKQLQSITLLSGGEKTMTAVALLFSIYMVKPSPFCILDEMDAPLDESNINRFIKILDRFVSQSQFVVISHNKRTIAKADIIYGVTMEEHGVSKLVGVKFTKREDSTERNDLMGTNNPAPIPSVAETFGKHGNLHSEREDAEAEAGGEDVTA
ncbi:MAG: chromosome segregation protein SMC [Verrucomicrobiota bacterium]